MHALYNRATIFAISSAGGHLESDYHAIEWIGTPSRILWEPCAGHSQRKLSFTFRPGPRTVIKLIIYWKTFSFLFFPTVILRSRNRAVPINSNWVIQKEIRMYNWAQYLFAWETRVRNGKSALARDRWRNRCFRGPALTKTYRNVFIPETRHEICMLLI